MKTPHSHKFRNTLALAIVGCLFIFVYFSNSPSFSTLSVSAETTDNVSGYAWSETIGWISFNNTSDGSATFYGVNVDTTNKATGGTGDFSGAAWSDNIGWISFNRIDTGTPPSAPFNGPAGPIAQVDWSTGKVTGWARVLSGIVPGDGWDGWIKLSDDTVPSWSGNGVKISGNRFSGYAWGGSDGAGIAGVIGWIDFAPAIGGVPIGVQVSATSCSASDPTVVWGSCQPIASCVTPPSQSTENSTGVQIGMCIDGGTVFQPCPIVLTCTPAPEGGAGGGVVCGNSICESSATPPETFISCPTDCPSTVTEF